MWTRAATARSRDPARQANEANDELAVEQRLRELLERLPADAGPDRRRR
ncbi:hypothetical protein [Actinocatenispora comari]|nr:hypothetical protein [Actinocatenispora comari]